MQRSTWSARFGHAKAPVDDLADQLWDPAAKLLGAAPQV